MNITTQSVASPCTPHLSMMPIVTLTFEAWPPKSIWFTMVNMSAKFDEEAQNTLVCKFHSLFPYLSTVTLTFGLWPPKSIGSILSPWLTSLLSLTKKYTTVWSISCSQTCLRIKLNLNICPLWPWPFDLRPPKSIGFILSPGLTYLPSLIKKQTTVQSLSCSKAYFHICPLWPRPLTSDFQNQ